MTTISGPRLRSLLRQAERVVDSGKMAAAQSLYQQIIDEDPTAVAGWLGLAAIATDEATKSEALEQAEALGATSAEIDQARDGNVPSTRKSSGEDPIPVPAGTPPPVVKVPPPEPKTKVGTPPPATPPPQKESIFKDEAEKAVEYDLFCYRHPDRATSLRCYKCNRPICMECTRKTSVGYLCPECQRDLEDTFFNAKPLDNLIVLAAALPLSLVAGFILARFAGGFGFFLWIILFMVGGAVGSFIGRMSKRIIGNRRGRYIPYIVAACLIFGVGFFFLPYILTLSLGGLLAPGIFLFVAVPAAIYWSR